MTNTATGCVCALLLPIGVVQARGLEVFVERVVWSTEFKVGGRKGQGRARGRRGVWQGRGGRSGIHCLRRAGAARKGSEGFVPGSQLGWKGARVGSYGVQHASGVGLEQLTATAAGGGGCLAPCPRSVAGLACTRPFDSPGQRCPPPSPPAAPGPGLA